MASKVESKEFSKGEIIFREGDLDNLCMYHLMWGKVGIYSRYGMKDQKLLTTLQPDDFFGEMALLEVRPRSATAVALEDIRVDMITGETFGDYLRENPVKVLNIMQYMSSRTRKLSDDYLDACDTIAEYLEAEEKKQPKAEGLLQRMRFFASLSRKKH